MKGFVTMYLSMPMTSVTLPIHGECEVKGRHVLLSFPFTGVEFTLPHEPQENQKDYDFKIEGARGGITVSIKYSRDLQCFTGNAKQDKDGLQAFKFFFSKRPTNTMPSL